MNNTYKHALLMGLAIIVVLTTAYGCARRTTSTAEKAKDTNLYPTERVMIVHGADEATRQYYRDDNGKIFYIDQNGPTRVIERSPRVERGAAGLYYIVDDNSDKYSVDDNGRLYYRDDLGNLKYIEDNEEGKVIDPLPLLRGESSSRIEYVQGLGSCNQQWRTCTSRCYDISGTNSRRECLNNCDIQRDQCVKP